MIKTAAEAGSVLLLLRARDGPNLVVLEGELAHDGLRMSREEGRAGMQGNVR